MKLSKITLAMVVAGMLGDKAQAHAVLCSVLCHAVDSAIRGNATELIAGRIASAGGRIVVQNPDGVWMSVKGSVSVELKGKPSKADALVTAFAAMGDVAKLDYVGKLTAPDAAKIAERAAIHAAAFSAAFIEVMPLETVKLTDEEKAAAKAKKADKADEVGRTWAADHGYSNAAPASGHAITGLSPAAIADAVVSMVLAGAFDAANLQVMADAVNPILRSAARAAKDARKVSA